MGSYLDEVIGQARRWDVDRPRSQQTSLGLSSLAGCRSYIGFKVREEWASDDEENWRAIAGTALHGWMAELRYGALHAGFEPCPVSFELEVEYQGVPGHVDEVLWAAQEVTDYKFPSRASARLFEDPEVLAEKMVQVHCYAAAILDADLHGGTWREDEVTVRLLVAPVNGTFDDWRTYEQPFDRSVASDAIGRLVSVHDTIERGEPLPKDKRYGWCEQFCEHFTACRGQDDWNEMGEITDPEMAAAVEMYGTAREKKNAAEKEMEDLADLLRGIYGTARGWKVRMSRPGAGKYVEDTDAMLRHYRDEGLAIPMVMKRGKPASLLVSREKK